MEQKEIKLKPKKQGLLEKINNLFKDKKKRGLFVGLFILPFLIAITVFGVVAFKEAKSLLELAKGQTEVRDENKIEKMNYVLRENATDIQKEYFAELKQAIEVDGADGLTIAGLVCKNYVTDFYTWTNKQGQYDISALYYVYTPQKNDIYLQARDGFYKYLNNYINEYGSKNLLEVSNVEVTNTSNAGYEYVSSSEETFDEVINVSCSWSYKEGSKFDVNKYPTKMNFLVVERGGRYEIVEASSNVIDARPVVEENVENEDAD